MVSTASCLFSKDVSTYIHSAESKSVKGPNIKPDTGIGLTSYIVPPMKIEQCFNKVKIPVFVLFS
jgi:hypothetical protein